MIAGGCTTIFSELLCISVLFIPKFILTLVHIIGFKDLLVQSVTKPNSRGHNMTLS